MQKFTIKNTLKDKEKIMFSFWKRKRNNKMKNKSHKNYSLYSKSTDEKFDNDKRYFDNLMQKYNKSHYLTPQEQHWIENNSYKFDE